MGWLAVPVPAVNDVIDSTADRTLSGVTSTELTQFLLLAALCLVVLITALAKARKHQLNIRYAAGWMLLSTLGIAAGALIPIVGPIADTVGVAAGVIVFVAATTVLVGLTMQLSISLSGALRQTELLALQQGLRSASQRVAQPSGEVVLVPAWNEAANITGVVTALLHRGHHVVVIDDGSTDGTGDIAENSGAVVLRLPFNLGVGAAIRCGLMYSVKLGVRRVVQCDADGQHPAEHVATLTDAADITGADLVIGSRFYGGSAPGMKLTFIRIVAMRILARIVARTTGTPITDATSGFRVISEPLLSGLAASMPSYYLGDTFETYVAAGRSGYQVVEVHAPIRERTSGSSSSSAMSSVLMLFKAIFLVSTRLGIRLPQRPNTTR